jgi:catechol 2,3-dioxygenase-like lactoylglutathione lyase family enzyme
MLDHVGLEVSDVAASKAFYDRALEPLGISVVSHWEDKAFGYGIVEKPDFWIHERGEVGAPVHIAFSAPDRGTVDEFHRAALEAGGRDNGEPGLRPYHENYYGAFVLDPDGNNVEAVCHRPEYVPDM